MLSAPVALPPTSNVISSIATPSQTDWLVVATKEVKVNVGSSISISSSDELFPGLASPTKTV